MFHSTSGHKSPPFQGGVTGSNPVWNTKLICGFRLVIRIAPLKGADVGLNPAGRTKILG